MNIAIVEDDFAAFNTLKSYLEKIRKEANEDIVIIHYENADKFLTDSLVKKDLIFMDIELPGTNGMDAALEYRKTDRQAVLIFVTNMAQFAIKGYEAEALDFIVKPVNYYDFSMKVKRAFRKLKDAEDASLTITLKDGVKRIDISDINYVETQNHRLMYHTKNGIIDVWGALNEIEKQLVKFNFSRCNSCYLVNLKRVTEVNGDDIVVANETLHISRRRRKMFMDDLTKYHGGGA